MSEEDISYLQDNEFCNSIENRLEFFGTLPEKNKFLWSKVKDEKELDDKWIERRDDIQKYLVLIECSYLLTVLSEKKEIYFDKIFHFILSFSILLQSTNIHNCKNDLKEELGW